MTTGCSGIYEIKLLTVVIYGYLERENDKIFKSHANNLSYYEINSSLF